MATVYKRTDRIVAHLPGVHEANVYEAERVAEIARRLFAKHDRPGGHFIEVTEGSVDAFASLVGPAASALEDGHLLRDRKTGKWIGYVEGIHVMRRAAGSA